MKFNWGNIKVFFKRLITALIVAGTLVVIYLLFPHRGKFPYEYQKGAFWGHETLIAPYDFPVYKSDAQIQSERDSVLKQVNPYFDLNPEIGLNRINEFITEWPQIWQRARLGFTSDSLIRNLPLGWDSLYQAAARYWLDSLYRTGIMPGSMVELFPDWDHRVLNVIVDQVATERQPGQVKDPVKAYEFLQRVLTDTSRINGDPSFLAFLFRTVGFNGYIEANLQPDSHKIEESRAEATGNISLSRGLVSRGQRIISRGDVVNNERWQMIDSYRKAYQKELGDVTSRWIVRIAQLLMILILISFLLLYLYHYRRDILNDTVKTGFIFFLLLLGVVAGGLIEQSASISIYLVPFIMVPVIIRNFFDSRTALFTHLVVMLVIGFLVPNGFEFILMQILVGFAAIISFQHLHRRGQLVMTALLVFFSYAVIYLSLSMMHEGRLSTIRWINLAWLGGNSLLVLVSYPLIFIFEKLFGFISDVTLIELSDSNHPLLRRMAEEAPGTFQHSLQVANLAESVIHEIGGNPLLVRTGAMYHDIGKTDSPFYFTENQSAGVNPHDHMNRIQSAEIIIAHVKRGAEIARKHRLPKPIIDFILTHHGTTKARFFLSMFRQEHQDEEIDEGAFTYPGPKPFSKETAVLMMADAIEAASRSLSEYTEEGINELVDRIIDHQMEEGQFIEADLTFRDIFKARAIFKKKLINIYHARIAYPD
ncbi:MAG: HDIG domain-containing protein [Bacteroidales bacterium]|nr:HDIG domain-containing protein [Bacteroidales bacterium]